MDDEHDLSTPVHRRPPWDPLPTESDEDASLFGEYLGSPPGTTLADFARQVGYSPTKIQVLAARNRWRARKAAFHHTLLQEQIAVAQDGVRARAEAQAALVSEALDFAWDSLRIRRARGEVLPLKDLAKLIKDMIELQRLQDGQATSRVALDLSGKTDEELAQAEKILEGLLTSGS